MFFRLLACLKSKCKLSIVCFSIAFVISVANMVNCRCGVNKTISVVNTMMESSLLLVVSY